MRRAIRTPLAVVFAVLVVTAGALGAVTFVDDDVTTLDDASDRLVQRGEGGALLVAGVTIGFAAGHYAYHEYIENDPKTEELQKADALETKKEIYDQGSIQEANNDQTLTTYQNYLNDTESIALMEGKNAYIKALENGSAESVARNEAIEAVGDYYATKQQNLIANWNISVTVMQSAVNTSKNTSGITQSMGDPGSFVMTENTASTDVPIREDNITLSMTLTNGTVDEVRALPISRDGVPSEMSPQNLDPTSGDVTAYGKDSDGLAVETTVTGTHIKAPTQDHDRLIVMDLSEYKTTWGEIESQNDAVQGQLDVFINNTYDSYQQGDINTSDLVDPYLGAREYTPETSETWNLRTLASMGLAPPENLSNIGLMNVTTDGEKVTGVLMTDNTPEGGFVINETYNATALNGSQWVAETTGDVQRLSGNFTITSAETSDGEAYSDGEAITYRSIDYQTADTQEFQALQQDLDELTAEINARQQNLRNSGGTGWLPQGVNLGQIAPIALIVGGALVLLGRN